MEISEELLTQLRFKPETSQIQRKNVKHQMLGLKHSQNVKRTSHSLISRGWNLVKF
jgi:hypothetical protein